MVTAQLETLPASESVRVIDFETSEVVAGIVNDTWFLVVSGEAPCMNMEVSLIPRMYVKCPEYWGIEVVGSLPGGFCLTAMKPYTLSIPLDGITGSVGVEVIGAHKTETHDVTGGCPDV